MNNVSTNGFKDDEVLRPRTAYNFFYRYQRDMILKSKSLATQNNEILELPILEIDLCMRPKRKRVHRKTHGLVSLQQLTKTVAKRWRELDKDSKSKFIALAEQDKIRYRNEVRARKVIRETFHPYSNQVKIHGTEMFHTPQAVYSNESLQANNVINSFQSPQSLKYIHNNEKLFTDTDASTYAQIPPPRKLMNVKFSSNTSHSEIEMPLRQSSHQMYLEKDLPQKIPSLNDHGSKFAQNFQDTPSHKDDETLMKMPYLSKYDSPSEVASIEAHLNHVISKDIFLLE